MPDTKNRPLRVFLCHASDDKPAVRELYRQLCAEGWLDVWLDEEKLLPGQEWDLEIEKAVEEADVVLVCLSTRSVDKEGYVQKELRFVLNIADEKPEGTIFVIPLRLEECTVPRRLRALQRVDFFPKGHQKQAYQRLLEILKLRMESLRIRTIMMARVTSGSGLRVRATPDMQAKILRTMPSGTQVEVAEIKDGWARLSAGGWSTAQWLEMLSETRETPAETPSPPSETKRARVTGKIGLRVHTAPDLQAEILRVLPFDMIVEIVEIKDGWARLMDGGWCAAQWLEVIK